MRTDPAATRVSPTTGGSDSTLLSVRGLTKAFLGTQALDDVDFDVFAGEVHALLGQNGAGKSTLIKILAGVHRQDAGTIQLRRTTDGQTVPIAFIHQDLGLALEMTVSENIALVAGYPRRHGLVSWSKLRGIAREAMDTLGVELDPDAEVSTLTPAERSLVAIARALALRAEVLVLDEPTAALPEADVEKLFAALARLRSQGVGLIYVTHRIDEVFRIADRVSVLRDGRLVATAEVTSLTSRQLVNWIVGRELDAAAVHRETVSDTEILQLESLMVQGRIGPVSLTLHGGDIVGLVGLSGAGQSETGRAVFGAAIVTGGSMRLGGRLLSPSSPADAVALGIGFVSGSRVEESIAADLSVRENLYINPVALGQGAWQPAGHASERRRAADALERFDIRPRDPERMIGSLSGGNQQKAVVARWLEAASRLLVLEEPTAGVDVGSKADIYRLLEDVAERGGAILVISSDFEEVIRLCRTTLVFNRGKVVAEVACAGLTVSDLTALAAGSRRGMGSSLDGGATHED